MTKNKIYSDFTDVLKNNLSLFPLSLADDYLKLCYQNAYGAEHLLLDLSRAKKYFDEEYEEVIPSKNDDLFQSIGNDIIRVNFAKYKYLNFDKEALFNIFCESAKKYYKDEDKFSNNIEITTEFIKNNKTNCSSDDFNLAFNSYQSLEFKIVSHSDLYRKKYNPHYRIVSYSLFIKYIKID